MIAVDVALWDGVGGGECADFASSRVKVRRPRLCLPVGEDFDEKGFPTVDAKGTDTCHPRRTSAKADRFGDADVGLGLYVGITDRVGAWGDATLDIGRAGTIACDGLVGACAISSAQTGSLHALDLARYPDGIGRRRLRSRLGRGFCRCGFFGWSGFCGILLL